jgi:hypothetical protein
MSENNAVEVKPVAEVVTPATPTESTTTKVEATATVSAPVESPAEKQDKKITAAFIAQRRENRELKERLAKANAVVTTSPPAPVVGEQAQTQIPQSIPAPVQVNNTAYDIEEASVRAIQELSKDPNVASLPGSILDIMKLVDTDTRLVHLHSIDPKLAFEEGKKMYLASAGIATNAPPIPMPNAPSGGMTAGSKQDLDALFRQLDTHRAGTREWYLVANKINAQLKQ